jgi:hypothetical protein
VQNGVWFLATAPTGTWAVAATVPAVIYTIPASSPLHYVTYVRVYSSTPTTVFVGYTPGYYGTVYTADGTVVYGTGYYYPAYVGAYWYPPPYYTYGYGAGFTVGFFFGFGMAGGWYGPCCYGGGGVYVEHHHHNNINVDNSYNRWGGESKTISGPGGREAKTTQVGNTTLAKGSESGNVYAGRDGNVYRRNDSGQWQQYGGKGEGWSDMGGNRPQQQPSRETVNSLDRQHQARDLGAQRTQQARQPSVGYYGGGAARAGGGVRAGGGRGGGRR